MSDYTTASLELRPDVILLFRLCANLFHHTAYLLGYLLVVQRHLPVTNLCAAKFLTQMKNR